MLPSSRAFLAFCKVSIISPIGLSALYLTLFQWNVFRYCSAGSAHISAPECEGGQKDRLTVVHRLLLGDLFLISFEYCLQRISHFPHYGFASRFKLAQLVRLLHKRIESSDLELRYRERVDCTIVCGYGRSESCEGFIVVVAGVYGRW